MSPLGNTSRAVKLAAVAAVVADVVDDVLPEVMLPTDVPPPPPPPPPHPASATARLTIIMRPPSLFRRTCRMACLQGASLKDSGFRRVFGFGTLVSGSVSLELEPRTSFPPPQTQPL